MFSHEADARHAHGPPHEAPPDLQPHPTTATQAPTSHPNRQPPPNRRARTTWTSCSPTRPTLSRWWTRGRRSGRPSASGSSRWVCGGVCVGSITSESAMDPSDGPKLSANGRESEAKQTCRNRNANADDREQTANTSTQHKRAEEDPTRLGGSSRKTPATRAASPPRACTGRSPRARATERQIVCGKTSYAASKHYTGESDGAGPRLSTSGSSRCVGLGVLGGEGGGGG